MRSVKVRYTDKESGKKETVDCSTIFSKGVALSLSVDIPVSRGAAWRLGMRYLREHG